MDIKKHIPIIIFAYLITMVLGNLFVKHFGAYGLFFTSFVFIPYDFMVRCLLHENWKGKRLFIRLFSLISVAAIITYLFNKNALNIALASVTAFAVSSLCASLFYQLFIKSKYFIKVNGSDLIGIIIDSILFQTIAFSIINPFVISGQILVKFIGGILWYVLLFKIIKIKVK